MFWDDVLTSQNAVKLINLLASESFPKFKQIKIEGIQLSELERNDPTLVNPFETLINLIRFKRPEIEITYSYMADKDN